MDALATNAPTSGFVQVGSLEELKAKGRIVVRGRSRPILLVYKGERVLALDNRCPHMGFPLDRGSIKDGTGLPLAPCGGDLHQGTR